MQERAGEGFFSIKRVILFLFGRGALARGTKDSNIDLMHVDKNLNLAHKKEHEQLSYSPSLLASLQVESFHDFVMGHAAKLSRPHMCTQERGAARAFPECAAKLSARGVIVSVSSSERFSVLKFTARWQEG